MEGAGAETDRQPETYLKNSSVGRGLDTIFRERPINRPIASISTYFRKSSNRLLKNPETWITSRSFRKESSEQMDTMRSSLTSMDLNQPRGEVIASASGPRPSLKVLPTVPSPQTT